MKKKSIAQLSLLVCFALFFSCKKGDTGPQGSQGVQGIPGNANIIIYNFGSKTFTGAVVYTLNNINQAKMDSMMVLAYYNPSTEAPTAWYPIPGLGSGGIYLTRYFLFPNSNPNNFDFSVRLHKLDGSSYPGSVTFTKFRIILAPASTIINNSFQGNTGMEKTIDVNSYESVASYFKISENL